MEISYKTDNANLFRSIIDLSHKMTNSNLSCVDIAKQTLELKKLETLLIEAIQNLGGDVVSQ